jgi:hypothetical protein
VCDPDKKRDSRKLVPDNWLREIGDVMKNDYKE